MGIPFISDLLKLATSSSSPTAGSIRYNGTKIQVSHAGVWEDVVSGSTPTGLFYNTMDLLRAATVPSDGTVVRLVGYNTEGDGGEGFFLYDSTSMADENGGTVITPDLGSGRYLRLDTGSIYNVKHFGAVGDGDSHPLSDYFLDLPSAQAVYPHAVALSDEIDWAAAEACALACCITYPDPSGAGQNVRGGTVFFPFGHYIHNRPITPPAGDTFWSVNFQGAGGQGFPGSSLDGGASWITYTGADVRYMDWRSACFMQCNDLTIWYNNASFSGVLFDNTWMPAVNADACGNRWNNCTFAGDPAVFGAGQGARAIISLHLALFCVVQGCSFGQSVSHIRFREFPVGGQSYSNKNIIRDCIFNYAKWNIVNVGDNTTVDDCTFEGLGGFTEACVYDDVPRTMAKPVVTFNVLGGGTQTIEIDHADGLTWEDFGFEVGMTPFFHDRLNRINGVNNLDLQPIASFSGGGTIMHFTVSPGLSNQTNTWGSLSCTGAFCQATEGVELTFSAAGDSITRNNGRWDDDGLTVGNSEFKVGGTTSNDGGIPVPISAISLDGKTVTFAGATFVDEVSTNAVVTTVSAAGPLHFARNWCGDQFLPGSSWLRFNNPIGDVVIAGNSFAGATRVLEMWWGGSNLAVRDNTLSALLRPIYVDDRGPGWGNALIENNGASSALFDTASQPALRNLWAICNTPGEDDQTNLTLDNVAFRSNRFLIGGDINPATLGDSSTYALLVQQGGAGTVGIGGDVGGAFITFFGTGRFNPGDTWNSIGNVTVPTSPLQVGGAIASPVAADQTSDFNVGYNRHMYPIDATGGNVIATLPTAVSAPGRSHIFKRRDASINTVTIEGNGSDTIEGLPNCTLDNADDVVWVKSDGGTNWEIIAKISAAAGSGDMLLGSVQTVTAAKSFNDGTLEVNNAGNTEATTLASAATVSRIWTLPDATDTAVGLATTDVLANKTLTRPSIDSGLVSSGDPPSVLAGAALGAGPVVSVAGNDFAHKVNITAGTGTSAGVMCTITFDSAFASPPKAIILQPITSAAANTTWSYRVINVTASSYDIQTDGAPTVSAAHDFYAIVVA